MRHRKYLLCILYLFCVFNPVSADLLDSEDFESYANVPFEIFDADDWSVAVDNEAVVNVIEANLTYRRGAVSVDGGSRALEIGPDMPSATTNNFADWFFEEVNSDDNSEMWFSFLLQTSETASTAIPGVAEDRDFFQLHFSEVGDQAQSVSLVLDNQTPVVEGLDSDHIFRARSGSSGNVTDTGQAVRTTPLQAQFIVGHIEAVNGEYETISIFANPGVAEVPAEPTAMATFDGMDAAALSQFSVRISALEAEDIYLLDELKIGESYADVVPTDTEFALGDFNSDGAVDLADFGVLADNLFDGTSYEQGDFDFSGQVDLNDFIAFRDAFSAAQVGAAPVPEPGGMALLIVGGWALACASRRRR